MLLNIQRKNLSRLLERYEFQHLRPQPDVYEIVIPEDQIFVDTGNSQKRRKIFYKVPYDPQQIEAIEDTKEKLIQINCVEQFTDQIILKHIYSAKFDVEKAAERLEKLAEFHKHQLITRFDSSTITRLESGCIYTYGTDKQMRPILIIRGDRFNYEETVDENMNSVYYLMLVLMGFKMVPYHVEKLVTIFDFDGMNLASIPYKFLYEVFTKMNLYYCNNTEKTFVYNVRGIGVLWSIASKALPEYQRRRIVFVDPNDMTPVLEQIDEHELEQRYGGKLPNLTQYWPPKSTNQEFTLPFRKSFETDFFSVQNNEDDFNPKSQKGMCSSPCNCTIY